MPVIRVLSSISMDDALPENAITNSWYFFHPTAEPEDVANTAEVAVNNFYQEIDTTVFPATMAATYTNKTYDMGDPEPRVPISTDTHTLSPSGSTAFPSEVALCLSFAGTPVSGISQARRRGRVFIGPLSASATLHVSTPSGIRPGGNLQDLLLDAAIQLQTQVQLNGVVWGVWSQTTRDSGAGIAASFIPAVTAWVDNAYDTQRRRGPIATSRDQRDLPMLGA